MTPPARSAPRHKPPLRWGRIATVAAAWVCIVIVGRSVTPSTTRAQPPGPAPEGAAVGTLVGRDYVVRITAGSQGPRYTVSTLSGQVLQSNLDRQGLARSFPSLDPASLQAAPGALMQADISDRPRD